MAKTALVISGGGSRGAFAVGVLKYLHQHHPDIRFDILCGTSTGSLISTLDAIGEISLLEKIFTSNNTEDIITTTNIKQRFTNHYNSLYTTTPLVHRINSIITDARFQAIMASEKTVFIAGKCLQTGRSCYFSNKQDNDNVTNETYDMVGLKDITALREALVASFSKPAFMPPVTVSTPETATKQFVECGGAAYKPFQLAIDHGATEIYAILLTPEKSGEKDIQFKDVLDILEETLDSNTSGIDTHDLQATLLYNHTLQYMDTVRSRMEAAGIPAADTAQYFDTVEMPALKGKKVLKIHIIRPETPLPAGMGGLEFKKEEMKEMIKTGEEVARHWGLQTNQ